LPVRTSVSPSRRLFTTSTAVASAPTGTDSRPLAQDVMAIASLRASIGSDITLIGDTNGAWSSDEARVALLQLAPLGFDYVEQPVAAAEWARLGPSAIAVWADESLADPSLREAILDSPDIVGTVCKPTMLGGLAVSMRIAMRAQGARAHPGLAVDRASTMTLPFALSIHDAAAETPDGAALIDVEGVVTTWSALCLRSVALGRAIEREAARAELAAGELVAFVARPTSASFVLIHALIAGGRPFLPIHPRLVKSEIEALIAAIGPAHVLDEAWIDDAVAAACTVVTSTPEAAAAAAAPCSEVGWKGGIIADDERTLAVLASSGTTGAPKGVVLSRRAFAAAARASQNNLPLHQGSRWIACMPLAHAGGLSILTRALVARSSVLLMPRFDVGAVAKAVSTHGATHLSVVPTMLRALVDESGAASSLSRLEAVLVGGAACPDALLAEARRAGLPALATYGLTEACSQVTTQPLSDSDRVAEGDSGVALVGTDVAIFDEVGGRLAANREGLIAVRGPTLATGYRHQTPLGRDAWFHTGDWGLLRTDGRLVVLARRTDLIVTGGENAYPAEIEAVLRSLPGVRDCAVVGVADERWGEVVGAVIVSEPDADLEALLAAASTRLAPHKIPRCAVAAEEALARTSKGEIDRASTRARYGASLVKARRISSGIAVGRKDVPFTTT